MKKFGALLLPVLIAVIGVIYAPSAYADVNDFTITKFKSEQTLTNTDKQGELRIIETIDVRFTDSNHGIIRAIPNDYNGQPLNFRLHSVTSSSGASARVDQSFSNGNVLLKIGDPNRTVTGAQSYTIDYTVQNVISFYDDHDELYWDVNGDQWNQPTTRVELTLHLPSGLTLSSNQPQCWSGEYNETQANCTITQQDNMLVATSDNLAPRETLTYVVGFNKGFFAPQTTGDQVKDNMNPLLSLLALPIAVSVAAFTWWWRRGRDAKGRGVIVPEYEPPKDISLIEAGALLDFKVDNRDITAMIIDLAVRKYIRIIETVTDRKILKDKTSYQLELLNSDYSQLTAYETTLLGGLFNSGTAGEKVELTVATDLSSTASKIRTAASKALRSNGYVQKWPISTGLIILVCIIAAVIGLALVFGHQSPTAVPIIAGGAIISTAVLAVFWSLMAARTTSGTQLREQLLGLKMYMDLTEKDRLAKLQAPNAPYANNIEPVHTVELFEKLLPYAIIFGIEKQWAEQFSSIYNETAPSWYSGNNTAFNSLYIANALTGSMGQALSSSFTPPSSSSISGFSSGGGFSGGGGGGGGGGGW